jgi:hypothetical protein
MSATMTPQEQADYKARLRANLPPVQTTSPRAEKMKRALALIATCASPEPQELSLEQRIHSIQSICETALKS